MASLNELIGRHGSFLYLYYSGVPNHSIVQPITPIQEYKPLSLDSLSLSPRSATYRHRHGFSAPAPTGLHCPAQLEHPSHLQCVQVGFRDSIQRLLPGAAVVVYDPPLLRAGVGCPSRPCLPSDHPAGPAGGRPEHLEREQPARAVLGSPHAANTRLPRIRRRQAVVDAAVSAAAGDDHGRLAGRRAAARCPGPGWKAGAGCRRSIRHVAVGWPCARSAGHQMRSLRQPAYGRRKLRLPLPLEPHARRRAVWLDRVGCP
jgi:hypothetical protein